MRIGGERPAAREMRHGNSPPRGRTVTSAGAVHHMAAHPKNQPHHYIMFTYKSHHDILVKLKLGDVPLGDIHGICDESIDATHPPDGTLHGNAVALIRVESGAASDASGTENEGRPPMGVEGALGPAPDSVRSPVTPSPGPPGGEFHAWDPGGHEEHGYQEYHSHDGECTDSDQYGASECGEEDPEDMSEGTTQHEERDEQGGLIDQSEGGHAELATSQEGHDDPAGIEQEDMPDALCAPVPTECDATRGCESDDDAPDPHEGACWSPLVRDGEDAGGGSDIQEPSHNQLSKSKLCKMRVAELKAVCTQLGLDGTGTKRVMVDNLLRHQTET